MVPTPIAEGERKPVHDAMRADISSSSSSRPPSKSSLPPRKEKDAFVLRPPPSLVSSSLSLPQYRDHPLDPLSKPFTSASLVETVMALLLRRQEDAIAHDGTTSSSALVEGTKRPDDSSTIFTVIDTEAGEDAGDPVTSRSDRRKREREEDTAKPYTHQKVDSTPAEESETEKEKKEVSVSHPEDDRTAGTLPLEGSSSFASHVAGDERGLARTRERLSYHNTNPAVTFAVKELEKKWLGTCAASSSPMVLPSMSSSSSLSPAAFPVPTTKPSAFLHASLPPGVQPLLNDPDYLSALATAFIKPFAGQRPHSSLPKEIPSACPTSGVGPVSMAAVPCGSVHFYELRRASIKDKREGVFGTVYSACIHPALRQGGGVLLMSALDEEPSVKQSHQKNECHTHRTALLFSRSQQREQEENVLQVTGGHGWSAADGQFLRAVWEWRDAYLDDLYKGVKKILCTEVSSSSSRPPSWSLLSSVLPQVALPSPLPWSLFPPPPLYFRTARPSPTASSTTGPVDAFSKSEGEESSSSDFPVIRSASTASTSSSSSSPSLSSSSQADGSSTPTEVVEKKTRMVEAPPDANHENQKEEKEKEEVSMDGLHQLSGPRRALLVQEMKCQMEAARRQVGHFLQSVWITFTEAPQTVEVEQHTLPSPADASSSSTVVGGDEVSPAPPPLLPQLVSEEKVASLCAQVRLLLERIPSTYVPLTYALKGYKPENPQEYAYGLRIYMLREVDLLLRLRHPNIVKGLEMMYLRPAMPTCMQEHMERQKRSRLREEETAKRKKEEDEENEKKMPDTHTDDGKEEEEIAMEDEKTKRNASEGDVEKERSQPSTAASMQKSMIRPTLYEKDENDDEKNERQKGKEVEEEPEWRDNDLVGNAAASSSAALLFPSPLLHASRCSHSAVEGSLLVKKLSSEEEEEEDEGKDEAEMGFAGRKNRRSTTTAMTMTTTSASSSPSPSSPLNDTTLPCERERVKHPSPVTKEKKDERKAAGSSKWATSSSSASSSPTSSPFVPFTASSVLASSASSFPSSLTPSSTIAPNTMFLAMEYCSLNLREYMFSPFLYFSTHNTAPETAKVAYLARVKCILYQVLQGVHFLHTHHILHRDLKPSNILLNRNGEVKLCDFGLSTFYQEGEPLELNVVTLYYRAPEILFGFSKYAAAVDVWSVGCIFAELLLQCPLFASSGEGNEQEVAAAAAARRRVAAAAAAAASGGSGRYGAKNPAQGQLLASEWMKRNEQAKEKEEVESATMQVLWRMCETIGIPNDESFPGVYNVATVKEKIKALPSWNTSYRLEEVLKQSTRPSAHILLDAGSFDASKHPTDLPDGATTPASISSGLDLLRRMLTWNPRDRIGAAEALQHPFFLQEYPPCCPRVELLQPLPGK